MNIDPKILHSYMIGKSIVLEKDDLPTSSDEDNFSIFDINLPLTYLQFAENILFFKSDGTILRIKITRTEDGEIVFSHPTAII